MTGPSGNRLSTCPERFSIASPRVSIDRGETSHYLFNILPVLFNLSNDILLPNEGPGAT